MEKLRPVRMGYKGGYGQGVCVCVGIIYIKIYKISEGNLDPSF